MDEFETELKNGFLEEATQLLVDAEKCFLDLETSPEDMAIIERIFRLAHNLKGSAKAVGFDQLGEFTHHFESFLLKLKNREIPVHKGTVTLLLRCNDHITSIVAALKSDPSAAFDSAALLDELQNHSEGRSEPPVADPCAEETPGPTPEDPFSAALEALAPQPDAPLAQADAEAAMAEQVGRLLAAETADKLRAFSEPVAPPAPQPKSAPREASAAANAATTEETIRVSLGRLEKLMNFVGELVILQTVLREQVALSAPTLRKAVHQLGKVTKEVQDISMSLRMVPLKHTFQKMQRIVRDTSSSLGKKVNLVIHGEDTEVDKTVLESLGDPLVHLIRNAVDHGIEPAERRRQSGKPEAGTIWLSAYHQGGNLVIDIRDDGAGLDARKLLEKAQEKGLVKEGAQLSDKECHQLIFLPGFSTKSVVTDVSGRGVGMDVVRTNIESLQGDIAIETAPGLGTTFRIQLPLTLAIVDGMVIRSGDERYVIPLSHVHESVRPTGEDVKFVTGMGEIFGLRGENLPLYRLDQLIGRKSKLVSPTEGIAIVVRTTERPFAVLVDDILGQHQVVIKQLGEEHRSLTGFAGSAILGDGRPALILELSELILKHRPAHSAQDAAQASLSQRPQRSAS